MSDVADERFAHDPPVELKQTAPHEVSLCGLAARLTTPRVLAILWVAVALNSAALFVKLPGKHKTIDFSLYYTAATALRAGVSPYTGDLAPFARRLGLNIGDQIHLPYTPPFLLAFEALTLLSPETAYLLWLALNLAALGASMFFLLALPKRAALLLAALMLLYPPLTDELLFAQSQLLVLLLLCLMFHCLDTDRDAAAGLAVGVAGALRVYPLVMLGYLVLKQRWRAAVFSVLTAAALGATAIAVLGWPACAGFSRGAHYALGYRFLSLPTNISLNGFVSRFFWNLGGPDLSPSLDFARHLAVWLAELGLLIFSARATLSSSGARAFPLWIATAIMISPTAWFHYLVLLFVLFNQLATAAQDRTCSMRTIHAAALSYGSAFVVNDIMLGLTIRYSLFYRWFGQFYFLSAFLAYLSAYWLATDRRNVACQNALDGLARSAVRA